MKCLRSRASVFETVDSCCAVSYEYAVGSNRFFVPSCASREHYIKDMSNFQRVGSKSNSHVGKAFEDLALKFFARQGIFLAPKWSVDIGHAKTAGHYFDLGSDAPAVLVECKSHTWTVGENSPSAKLTVWNEAMYYFLLAPPRYRKIFFVLKHLNAKRGQSLAAYYLSRYGHLVPADVEIWEYDETSGIAERINNT